MTDNLDAAIDKFGETALRIKAERDELLAALKNLLDECLQAGFGEAEDFGWPERIEAARAVIAKCEAS